MRVTAEQFNTRKERRVRGEYVVKPPNTERRGRKVKGPQCEQCGRQTEYLFHGQVASKATRYDARTKKAIGVVDVYRDAMVCLRCLPPSNLEIKELLEEGRYKGQTIELKTL